MNTFTKDEITFLLNLVHRSKEIHGSELFVASSWVAKAIEVLKAQEGGQEGSDEKHLS